MSEQATPPNPSSSGPVLCLAGCGFFGNPQNGNLCSRCARERKAKQEPEPKPQSAAVSPAPTPASPSPAPASSGASPMAVDVPVAAGGVSSAVPAASPTAMDTQPTTAAPVSSDAAPGATQTDVSRCWGCQRKVGLLGFKCRCGFTFCSRHRHSDQHACSFDYKAAAAEQLRKNNPVVQAAKINKI